MLPDQINGEKSLAREGQWTRTRHIIVGSQEIEYNGIDADCY